MPDIVSELANQGRALTPAQRVQLMDLLLASLEGPLTGDSSDPWDSEIARRVAEHEAGLGELHDADAVMAEARSIAP